MESKSHMNSELNTEIEAYKRKINDLEAIISDYKSKENIVSEIEKKYGFVVNAYGEFMTLINRNYKYELVNDSWCKTFRIIADRTQL